MIEKTPESIDFSGVKYYNINMGKDKNTTCANIEPVGNPDASDFQM